MRTIFLHSIIVLHKIAVLQFIRKSTSIFPPTAYYFFYNRSSCFLLFDQSKFYMFKVGTDLYFIFLPYVCRCTFCILRLFYMCMRVKYVLSYFFYLKYYNLYFNTFLFVNILLFLFICQYFLL